MIKQIRHPVIGEWIIKSELLFVTVIVYVINWTTVIILNIYILSLSR